MTKNELYQKILEIGGKLEDARGYFDLDKTLKKIKELEQKTQDPSFWQNVDMANSTFSQLKRLRNEAAVLGTAEQEYRDIKELIELSKNDDTAELKEIEEVLTKLELEVGTIELAGLLSGKCDLNNAILSMHAGAGGTESCDWVSMLTRMYTRWAESKKFRVKVIDILPGEEAGIKNITMIIEGDYAYGYLKAEGGVHRLVRISPFDANKRRHTSFASVDVIPEIEDNIEITVNTGDLKIDTYRAGGAGGQHINVTDSAVRITHIPTGIIVQCQDERSQHQNKAMAMKVLKARLYELERKKQREEVDKKYEEKGDIAWGNQIRSYVFTPYTMVKDHRTGFTTGNVSAVMDGRLDEFMQAYLKLKAKS
ncbi:MAG: peptide chain release factor 2 [Candidatus Omnitrophota bacterium]